MGGIHFEDDGTVTIVTGTLDYGQGHWTPFAQVLHDPPRRAVRQDPPRAGRQRPPHRRRRHGRLEVDHGERRGHRRGERPRHREGQGCRRACARGGRRRHRVRATAASPSPAPTARSASWSCGASCARRPICRPDAATSLDVDHVLKAAPSAYPERLPRRRGRDRPGHGRHRGRALHDGQRFRHAGEPDARRGPAAWRRRAGHRPGADGADGVSTTRASS